MDLKSSIVEILQNSEQLKQPYLGTDEILALSDELLTIIESEINLVIEMRYAQRSYFRRRNEDNLSKAKRLECLVDSKLLPFDKKSQIPIQIGIFPINY